MAETGKAPKRSSIPDETSHVDLVNHQRRCQVCKHPDRAAIEEQFLHWHSPDIIAEEYELSDRSTIYRHAHATGLFNRRRKNLRWALERIVEQVDSAPITAHSVVTAVLAYARVNEAGEWVAPPTEMVVTHINRSRGGPTEPRPLPGEERLLHDVRDAASAFGVEVVVAFGRHAESSRMPDSSTCTGDRQSGERAV